MYVAKGQKCNISRTLQLAGEKSKKRLSQSKDFLINRTTNKTQFTKSVVQKVTSKEFEQFKIKYPNHVKMDYEPIFAQYQNIADCLGYYYYRGDFDNYKAVINDKEKKIQCSLKNNYGLDIDLNFLWKLFIDGNYHELGKFCFENEKYYLYNMYNAFDYMLSQKGKQLSAEMYEDFHILATHTVVEPKNWVYRKYLSPMFKLIPNANSSQEGLDEYYNANDFLEILVRDNTYILDNMLKTKQYIDDKDDCSSFRNAAIEKAKMMADEASSSGNVALNKAEYDQMIIESVDKLIIRIAEEVKEYGSAGNDARSLASTVFEYWNSGEKKKDLKEMIKLCKTLDQLHLFTDGNIRTIVFIVLQKLLLDNGYKPIYLADPNIFDMFSIDQIFEKIKHYVGRPKMRAY